MHDRDRTLQRSIDGELGAAENAAVQHLLAADSAARDHARSLERLDRLLRTRATALARGHEAHDQVVSGIVRRMPSGAPERQKQLRLLDLVFAGGALTAVVLFYGLVGSLRDLLPLTAMAVASFIAGLVLIVMARPLRKVETGFITRVLRKRVNLGSGDLLVYRVTGIAIVIGGIWLLSEIV
jgi:anti-sigma factor RsiW